MISVLRGKQARQPNVTGTSLLRSAQADRFLPAYRRAIRRELAREGNEAAANVLAGVEGDPVTDALEREWVRRLTDLLFRWAGRMVTAGAKFAFTEVLLFTSPNAIEVAGKQAEVLGAFDLPLNVDNINSWVDDVSTSIARTSRKRLTAAFQEASTFLDETFDPPRGLTPRAIAKRMLEAFATNSRFRAIMLARTGTIWAYNEGAVQTYLQAGVGAMRWVVTRDDLLCPFCAGMDGVVIRPGGNFWEGGAQMQVQEMGSFLKLNLPFDVQHPPLHPNCRCTIIPILAESLS